MWAPPNIKGLKKYQNWKTLLEFSITFLPPKMSLTHETPWHQAGDLQLISLLTIHLDQSQSLSSATFIETYKL